MTKIFSKTDLLVIVGWYPGNPFTDNVYTDLAEAEKDCATLTATPCSDCKIMNLADYEDYRYEQGSEAAGWD